VQQRARRRPEVRCSRGVRGVRGIADDDHPWPPLVAARASKRDAAASLAYSLLASFRCGGFTNVSRRYSSPRRLRAASAPPRSRSRCPPASRADLHLDLAGPRAWARGLRPSAASQGATGVGLDVVHADHLEDRIAARAARAGAGLRPAFSDAGLALAARRMIVPSRIPPYRDVEAHRPSGPCRLRVWRPPRGPLPGQPDLDVDVAPAC